MTIEIPFVYNDGGRAQAGWKGDTGDCVCRAICIALERDYEDIRETLVEIRRDFYFKMSSSRSARKQARAERALQQGTNTHRLGIPIEVAKDFLKEQGWLWIPTMSIGSGCKVHLHPDELPEGRLIARTTKHLCAVIDGVINDTYDPSRGGTRCVYGYYKPA